MNKLHDAYYLLTGLVFTKGIVFYYYVFCSKIKKKKMTNMSFLAKTLMFKSLIINIIIVNYYFWETLKSLYRFRGIYV